jgi:hypothetical protein
MGLSDLSQLAFLMQIKLQLQFTSISILALAFGNHRRVIR